jgi:hypothetical protein
MSTQSSIPADSKPNILGSDNGASGPVADGRQKSGTPNSEIFTVERPKCTLIRKLDSLAALIMIVACTYSLLVEHRLKTKLIQLDAVANRITMEQRLRFRMVSSLRELIKTTTTAPFVAEPTLKLFDGFVRDYNYSSAMPLFDPSTEQKAEDYLNVLFAECAANKNLDGSAAFIAMKSKFTQVEADIERLTAMYNEKALEYNFYISRGPRSVVASITGYQCVRRLRETNEACVIPGSASGQKSPES